MKKDTIITWILRIIGFLLISLAATGALYASIWVLIQIITADKISKTVMIFGVISTIYIVWRYEPRDRRHLPENKEQRKIIQFFIFFQVSLYLVNRFIINSQLIQDYQKTIFPTYFFTFIIILALIEEMILGITPKKARERWQKREITEITVSEKGNDNPWFGDMRYIEEYPVEKTFIRGFNDDMNKLAEIITKISGKHSLLFYALYEPKKRVYNDVINFAVENGLHNQLMKSNLGESLAIECKNIKSLEKLLSFFWVEEYICWIAAHDLSFTNMDEYMHTTLNPVSFPDGFHELIQSTYCFFRDVEYGRTLLMITDKLGRDKISKLIK